MKTSTEISNCASFIGVEKTIELIAASGFDAWDFSMIDLSVCGHPLSGGNWRNIVRRYKEIGEDNGIICNQSHAPFPPSAKGMEKLIIRALECSAEAGAKICVVHPDCNRSIEENADFYLRLLPIAKDLGVRIAAENLYLWDDEKNQAKKAACSNHNDYKELIMAVGDDFFVACLDIGHAEMKGLETSAIQMIGTLKKHIKALHIHDNDLWRDCHQLPYTMNIDFSSILKSLYQAGYDGYFTFETKRYITDGDDVAEKMKTMAKTARKMAREFELYSRFSF